MALTQGLDQAPLACILHTCHHALQVRCRSDSEAQVANGWPVMHYTRCVPPNSPYSHLTASFPQLQRLDQPHTAVTMQALGGCNSAASGAALQRALICTDSARVCSCRHTPCSGSHWQLCRPAGGGSGAHKAQRAPCCSIWSGGGMQKGDALAH